MATTENCYIAGIELPKQPDFKDQITGTDLQKILFYFISALNISDLEEYDAYLDSIPEFDILFEKVMIVLPFLEERIKNGKNRRKKHGRTP